MVLGSLYQDELVVEPAEVVPLLATATLLQLDGVIDQCVAIMEETVNAQVCSSYSALLRRQNNLPPIFLYPLDCSEVL